MGILIENGYVETLYAFLLVFWLVYLYFVKHYGYWEERRVPHVPAIFPIGSIGKLLFGYSYWGEAMNEVYKQFPEDRYVGFFYVREPSLLVLDPELIKLILQTDFENFTDRTMVEVNPRDFMASNMFNMRGREWKQMRKKLVPAYNAARMEMMLFLVKKSSEILKRSIERIPGESKIVDAKDLLSRVTMDIIANCIFGKDINSLANKDGQFYEMGKRAGIFSPLTQLKMFLLKSFPFFTKFYCFDLFDPKVKQFFYSVMVKSIIYRENMDIQQCDFLGLLINVRNEIFLDEGERSTGHGSHSGAPPSTNRGLTVEEMTAEMNLFIMMGHETTTNTCMFCLFELARHRYIQEKLFAEVNELLGYQGNISFDALQQMTYLDQVINETMRLYPPVAVLSRNCTKNYRVPNSQLIIEKGMQIFIPVHALHHDPKYFPDPYTFNPDRFGPGNTNNYHPYVFIPFGAGPRICIGFRFGLIKIKSALATIVANYVVSLPAESSVNLTCENAAFATVTVPDKPVKLQLTRRRTSPID